MKTVIVSALVLGLTASASFADEPMKLTAGQMDPVKGGLVTVVAFDVVDVNNNDVDVAIPLNAAAAIAILGKADADATQLGRVRQ